MAAVLGNILAWIGIIGVVIIIIAAIVWLIFSYSLRRAKKKFNKSNDPKINKIKKEVENERRLRDSRRDTARERYQGREGDSIPAAEPNNRRELFSVEFD